MHSHILPGIDDGAPDVATSIDLIQGMMQSGIKKFMGTPHIMAEVHRNSKDTISNAFGKLKESLKEKNIEIDLRYAAEYMIDEGFLNHLEAGNMLTVHDNVILIETPFYHEPLDIDDILFQIGTSGYDVILAHPERYHYFDDKFKVFEKYIDRDMKLQVNLLSLSGYYGSQEKENAKRLLEAGLYSYIGTDLHHERHLKRMSSMVLDKKIIKILENTEWKNELIAKQDFITN